MMGIEQQHRKAGYGGSWRARGTVMFRVPVDLSMLKILRWRWQGGVLALGWELRSGQTLEEREKPLTSKWRGREVSPPELCALLSTPDIF